MPSLLPNARQQFFGPNGIPCSGGTVFLYIPNTTTYKASWQDSAGTVLNTQPIQLDANGECVIWGTGLYRQQVFDVNGNLIWDQVSSCAASGAELGNTNPPYGASLIGFDGTTLDQQFLSRANRVIDSVSALRSVSKLTYTRVFCTGYYAPHDGGGGAYQYDSSDTTSADNGCTVIVATDGGRWKLQHFGRLSVMQAGAKGDGTTVDTNSIQNAVATGLRVFFPKPASFYVVTDGISCTTKGQIIEGDGRVISVIKGIATFNLSAQGVFIANTGEEGPHFRNLKITFAQPDTSVRASLVNYPPALYMRATPRFTVENCMITQAMTGIDMTGNSGGAFITQLEMSAYNYGILIDGSLDSVRVDKLQFWNFDLTPSQVTLWNDGNTVGLQSARCDDFHMTNSLFINKGKQVNFTSSANGSTFGEVLNTDFDTYGGLYVSAGDISVTGCFMSVGDTAARGIYQTGGFLKLANNEIEAAVTTTNPLIQLAGAGDANNGYMEIVGGTIRITGDQQAISGSASSGATNLIVSGVQFTLPQSTSPVNAVIAVATGCRATIVDCRAVDKGTGTGNFIQVVTDDNHVITGNTLLGWNLALPSTLVLSVVNNNSTPGNDFTNGYLTGCLKTKRITGTLDGSGNLTVAHGITNGQQKALQTQVFYKGGGGEMRQMTLTYVDGTNIAASGGTASAPYRATIMWTETQQGW
jgi:hypothetical protein